MKLLFFLFILWCTAINAQEKRHRNERYVDAYKKYVNNSCPIVNDSIQHFVYFSRDRQAIINHPFLLHPRFAGAQIMYSWRDFESKKDEYDFSILAEDIAYLKKYGKKIFIQIQDVTFNPKNNPVPDYLMSDEYDGGAVLQYNDEGKPEGWVAKRWNKKVRGRFALLLHALGKTFDGKIAGINLQETSIGIKDPGFSQTGYVEGLKENMLALKQSFLLSVTMIYANFIPGEWLPYDDKGYMRGIYQYGEQIGVGLGGPDLMVTQKPQLNHALAMMHEGQYSVPIGIAVQDGNYIGKTGAAADEKEILHTNIVPMLYGFAKDFLHVHYMFWSNQQPYFMQDVFPCLSVNK